ncbi:PAP2 superfamily protein [Geodermatophilus saharensis]|uniref:PAP2 superfamily protein n=1 Tax=Geodermatophilus saharensis TaxID=1137994 RepID=A0A239CPU2_9ACTN|nr:vanadium-dependent haloperoxidase [Geodermatophilus saharensis]SNS21882.1 PAP2 superfamily protein [Geodermatophilus saharensis]
MPGPVSRRQVLLAALGTGTAAVALPRTAAAAPVDLLGPGGATAAGYGADEALRWLQTTYDLVLAENLSPPAAARTYAHTAIAMYEAAVRGMPAHRSLGGQLRDLPVPAPRPPAALVDWPAAVVTSAATVLRQVLPFAGADTRERLDAAEAGALLRRRAAGVPERALDASVVHGRAVAGHLAPWIAADGHAGTLGRPYTPPATEPWHWVSTPPNFRPAVEPYWSEVRPMVLTSADEVEPEPPLPFSTEPGSAFHAQAAAVHRQSAANTDEHRAIARFWTDNPGSSTPPAGTPTGLPSGHWMLIATQALALRGARLDVALDTLAMTGVALHEAFLNCWTWKYRYQLLRPVTYVNRYIDPGWTTYVNSPQFPEHTSGHSVASPAAAAVLTDRLGVFPFTDRSHDVRGHAPRTFASFADAAREAADSRLYGGIHFPHAIEAGLAQGAQVGALVLRRIRTRR